VITEEAVRKIARFAFEYARANKRKKVTIVHKANIIKFGDGLFLRVAQEVSKDYPEIETNDRIVDNMCMQLMQKPGDYDVLVMENLFGDIVSDLVAGMVGGLGVAPGGNIGDGVAVFEPIHGSAPSHAGKDEANPTAMILSGAMMLRHLGELDAAIKVEQAVADVIREGKQVTYDLRPDRDPSKAVGTSGMTQALVERIQA
jgi:isocitrate dehydrogenase (NAD+)